MTLFVLLRKYPLTQNNNWLKDNAIYCSFVFLILYLLQPFGFNMYSGNKFLVALLFGGVSFGCCVVFHLVSKPICQKVVVWRVWHELLMILSLILFIGACNSIVFSLIFVHAITLEVCLLFMYWTFIIGIIISTISVSVDYHRYLRNKLELLIDKTSEQQSGIVITIHDTNVRGSDLQISINNLLYIEAQKNNIAVCYAKDGQAIVAELHTTLSSALNDLQEYKNIFQCHRSFAVNVNNILSAQGNSNGYQLTFENCHTVVPVSRTYVPKLRSYIA